MSLNLEAIKTATPEEIEALLKAVEARKNSEKVEVLRSALVEWVSNLDSIEKLNAIAAIRDSKSAPKVADATSAGTRKRFDLKAEHTVAGLVSALEKGKSYKVAELLQAVGIVEGMELNGAAGFDSYVQKYKSTVLAEAKERAKIVTTGEKVSTVYSVA